MDKWEEVPAGKPETCDFRSAWIAVGRDRRETWSVIQVEGRERERAGSVD